MSGIWGELRRAVRSLAREPVTAWGIVATLALGLGANTAIFSVVKGVLLDPLPYPQAERIVAVLSANPEMGMPRFTVSAPDYLDFAEHNQVFTATAAATTASLHLTGGDGEPERLFGVRTTSSLFDVLGRSPALGRRLTASDDRPGVAKVVILADSLWRRRYGADPGVIGRSIELSGEPYEVVGVMAEGSFPYPRDFFIPLGIDLESAPRGRHELIVFGRLADGVTVERAASDLATLASRLAAEYPETNTGWTTVVNPWKEMIVEEARPALTLLWWAVALVLAVAGVNAVTLFVVRLERRRRDLALRAALGAGRRRLLATLLGESVLLTLAAAAAALAVAGVATRALVAAYAGDLPRGANVDLDAGVLAYAVGVALATGLAVGLLPALRASRPDLRGELADAGGGHTPRPASRRLRRGLMLVEVALAFVLVVAAGLLGRSLGRLTAVDPGFAFDGLVTARIELPAARYHDEASRAVFYRTLFAALDGRPGVGEHGAVSHPPLHPRGLVFTTLVEGEPPPPPGQEPVVSLRATSPGLFTTLTMPLVEGRPFDRSDDESSGRVAVVSESAARRLWPGKSPLGRRLDVELHQDPEPRWRTVIGVVGDVQGRDLTTPPLPAVWVPFLQVPFPEATLVARGGGSAARQGGGASGAVGALREAVAAVDPSLPLFEVQPYSELVAATTAHPRFQAVLLTAFAAIALALAALGVYGVVAESVARQRREIGIRQALGAGREKILRLVLGEGLWPVAAGLALGLAAAPAAVRLLRGMLYGVGAGDLASWLGALGLLAAVAVAAAAIPAWRATRLAPWRVLREE